MPLSAVVWPLPNTIRPKWPSARAKIVRCRTPNDPVRPKQSHFIITFTGNLPQNARFIYLIINKISCGGVKVLTILFFIYFLHAMHV